MNYKFKLTLLVSLLVCLSTYAQNTMSIKGQVSSSEDNEPIPGVNVVVANSNNGTVTDFDGNFEISAAAFWVFKPSL